MLEEHRGRRLSEIAITTSHIVAETVRRSAGLAWRRPAAEGHLGLLDARDQATVLDSVVTQLTHEPTVGTRNRKRMRPNRLAPWVLRIGTLRVYYEVSERPERLVTVRAVGVKDRNRVTIAGEEIDLS